MKRNPFTILVHIALVIIVAGALVTHFVGIRGYVTLYTGAGATDRFNLTSGPGDGRMPFGIMLDGVEILYYPGTTTPMDFKSRLDVEGELVTVSMNRVGEVRGWRFCQSGISAGSSTLSISYDPWGTAITYIGYVLLGIGMTGFFLQRDTPWRALLRNRRVVAVASVLIWGEAYAFAGELPSMQRPLAADLGKVYVYWNDRVCPLQTMARDVAVTLYGSETYKGMTSEQVLSGWLFYYDEWRRDYLEQYPETAELPQTPQTRRERRIAERIGLVQWLGTGEAFRIYPYRTVAGDTEWLSLTGLRPSGMDLEQWKFMQTTMPRLKGLLLEGRNIKADEALDSLKQGQIRYGGVDLLPSERKMDAERMYNRWARPAAGGTAAILIGGVCLFFAVSGRREPEAMRRVTGIMLYVLLGYLLLMMGGLWWISGHIPLSNGPETMLFMGLAAVVGALLSLRHRMVTGALCIVGAMSLFVAAMGGRTPRIGMLMPVLSSPLLSAHVMVVMTSYVLFLLMAVLSAVGLCVRSEERRKSLSVTNRLILTPAVCLLGAGIFVGAVWANRSWGRYWGWDPKETCALVTWLIYALPMHWGAGRLGCFRRPGVLHRYLLLAILSVVFTYFGANYLLPGLHSYA